MKLSANVTFLEALFMVQIKAFLYLHRIGSLSCYNEVGISRVQQKIVSSEDAAQPDLPFHPSELLQTIVGWRKYFLLGSRFAFGSQEEGV